MSIDLTKLRLGKKAARHDRRTLCLAKYLKALPPAPASIDWSSPIAFPCGMMLNDTLGDCTCAGPGHSVQVTTANANPPEITLPDSAILSLYEGSCGYVNGDPSTDQGGDLLTVLNYWRKNGIGGLGHNIAAFASINVLDHNEVMQALNLFGFLYTGVQLPVSAQDQVGEVWDVNTTSAGAPGSWGGHCVIIVKADATGLWCITWGALQQMTWAFWLRYFDEAFAVLTPDWIKPDLLSASGFNLAALQADLAQIT
jgi:hypothetical protein